VSGDNYSFLGLCYTVFGDREFKLDDSNATQLWRQVEAGAGLHRHRQLIRFDMGFGGLPAWLPLVIRKSFPIEEIDPRKRYWLCPKDDHGT
jgi:hypothetical protein